MERTVLDCTSISGSTSYTWEIAEGAEEKEEEFYKEEMEKIEEEIEEKEFREGESLDWIRVEETVDGKRKIFIHTTRFFTIP